MTQPESFQQALREGLEGVVRSLERIRDDLHRLELTHTKDDTEMRALVTSTRQWIGGVAAIVRGEKGGEPILQQLAMIHHRLDVIEAVKKNAVQTAAQIEAAKVGAKAKINAQLIMTIGSIGAALAALAVALLK